MQLSVVIPVFNEEESLKPLLEGIEVVFAKLNIPAEVVLIDDGSTDGSLHLMRELAGQKPYLKVLSFKRNFGQTAALSAGIRNSTGEVIITMDADLQNDPEDIILLLALIAEGNDVVSGWRKHRNDKFITRILPSTIANFIISLVSGVKLHDYGCTMKAYRREMICDVNLYGEMHRFIPIYTKQFGAKIKEAVVKHHPRKFGQSKYNLSRTSKVLLDLLTVKFLNDYYSKPMHFFGGFGMISFVLGIASFAWATVLKFQGMGFIHTPLPLLTVFFCLVGFQLILMGLLAEMIMRNYFERQDRTPYSIKEKINFD